MKARSWKAAETRFARDVGTERRPCDGSRAGADFASGPFYYQLKYRRSFPLWIWAWLQAITAKAAETTQTGVLILNRPRGRDEEAIVVLRWKDWLELHGGPDKLAPGGRLLP